MGKYSAILSKSIVVFCIVTICLYILMSIYLDWEKNKFEYGVLRSFGMSYSTLQRKAFLRYLLSMAVASLVSLRISYEAFPHGEITIGQIMLALGITLAVAFICRIVAYILNRKKAVCDMLNKS